MLFLLLMVNYIPIVIYFYSFYFLFLFNNSSIYFSLVLLTEYANIVSLILFIIIIFSLIFNISIILLLLICLIRSTLNRLKFDELMTNCWIVILPIIFIYLLIALLKEMLIKILALFIYYMCQCNYNFNMIII